MRPEEVRRAVARLIKEIEVEVPDGHARRNKGQTHRFARAKDLGPFSKRLCEVLGTVPEYVHEGYAVPFLVWRSACPAVGWQAVLWLPAGDDFFVVSV